MRVVKFRETESRRGNGELLFNGYEFQFCKIKKWWEKKMYTEHLVLPDTQ